MNKYVKKRVSDLSSFFMFNVSKMTRTEYMTRSVYLLLFVIALNLCLSCLVLYENVYRERFLNKAKKKIEKTADKAGDKIQEVVDKAVEPIKDEFSNITKELASVPKKIQDGFNKFERMLIKNVFEKPVDKSGNKNFKKFMKRNVNYNGNLGSVVIQTLKALVIAGFLILVMTPIVIILLKPVVFAMMSFIVRFGIKMFFMLFKKPSPSSNPVIPPSTKLPNPQKTNISQLLPNSSVNISKIIQIPNKNVTEIMKGNTNKLLKSKLS
jgi:hypothetical protein